MNSSLRPLPVRLASTTRLLSLAFALGSAPACIAQTHRVAVGERFVSGMEPYDTFFDRVYALQHEPPPPTRGPEQPLQPLAHTLQVGDDATTEAILRATRERASRVGGEGSLRLDLGNDGDAHVVARAGVKVDAPFHHALEESARLEIDALKSRRRMDAKLEDLLDQDAALDARAAADFARFGDRRVREVRDELSAAKQVLAQWSSDARQRTQQREELVTALQRAVSGDGLSKPPPSTPHPKRAGAAKRPSSTDAPLPAPKPSLPATAPPKATPPSEVFAP